MRNSEPIGPLAVGAGWPASVAVCVTRRMAHGPGYDGFNVGLHVGDRAERVLGNRRRLEAAGVPPVVWLDQVHGKDVVWVDAAPNDAPLADAAATATRRLALAIMVADCLPVVLADAEGRSIAAVHCGWRGLAAGVLEAAVATFDATDLRASFGPAIGPCHYEVGEDVAGQFRARAGVVQTRGGSRFVDLYAEAVARLKQLGVSCGPRAACTHCAPELFSYRRDGTTGRQAVIAWLR